MDYLQSNPVTYRQEYQGCSLGGGGGIGERPALTYEYSQKGGLLTVAATSSAGGMFIIFKFCLCRKLMVPKTNISVAFRT